MTIVFVGDIHQQWQQVERGLDALEELPRAAVLLGDMQCERPLDELAAPLLDRGIDVHWIFGNHDNDGGPEMWANLVSPERNPRTTSGALHARVVEVAGVRIAGLGGTFRPRIWEPPEPPRVRRRADLPDDLASLNWVATTPPRWSIRSERQRSGRKTTNTCQPNAQTCWSPTRPLAAIPQAMRRSMPWAGRWA